MLYVIEGYNKNMKQHLRHKIRMHSSFEKEVVKRDGYVCKKCSSEDNVHAHDIVSKFGKTQHRCFIMENGIMLCKACREKVKNNEKGYKTEDLYALINSSEEKVIAILSSK